MGRIKGFNDYEIIDNYVVMRFMRKGERFLDGYVDLDMLDYLIDLNWVWNAKWHRNIRGYYAIHTEYMGTILGIPHYKTRYLHNTVLPTKDGLLPDHINHNGLDNRKHNLRPSTNAENIKNSRRNRIINANCDDVYFDGIKYKVNIAGINYDFPERFKTFDEAMAFSELMKEKHCYSYV
jgi:hypothetical protein